MSVNSVAAPREERACPLFLATILPSNSQYPDLDLIGPLTTEGGGRASVCAVGRLCSSAGTTASALELNSMQDLLPITNSVDEDAKRTKSAAGLAVVIAAPTRVTTLKCGQTFVT